MAKACEQIDSALGLALHDPALALSEYAWRFRYPGAPYEPDAQGRTLAEKVRMEILKRLPIAATADPGTPSP